MAICVKMFHLLPQIVNDDLDKNGKYNRFCFFLWPVNREIPDTVKAVVLAMTAWAQSSPNLTWAAISKR